MIHWQLKSTRLSDGAECLELRREGELVYSYAPGVDPHQDIWHLYSKGFPLKEMGSREQCLDHARQVSCCGLEIEEG